MNIKQIEKILSKNEGYTVEFKQSQTALPENIFETICAFLNRLGGDLFLGVNDDGDVIGIHPDKVDQIKNNLVSLLKNPNKLDPPSLLFPQELEIATIVKFFQQMGRPEELGSGIRNIKKYLPLYSKHAKFKLIKGGYI